MDKRRSAMISENLAREVWGSPSAAIGKKFREYTNEWWEVVGVVQDVRENGVSEKAPASGVLAAALRLEN